MDMNNHKVLRVYDSIFEAQQAFGCTHVSLCCRRKRHSDGGYLWRYAEVLPGDPGTPGYRFHKNQVKGK